MSLPGLILPENCLRVENMMTLPKLPSALKFTICLRCIVAGGSLAGLCLSGCDTAPEPVVSAAPTELPTLRAEVLQIELVPWPRIVRSHGSLVSDETAVIGSRQEGRVEKVHVDLGDVVNAGTELVTLYQAEFQLRVEQAEAQLLQARSAVGLERSEPVGQLDPKNAPPVMEQKALWTEALANVERARQLSDRKTITPAEFEQIAANAAVLEARYRAAINNVRERIALIGVREAELLLAREALKDTVIRSPFDGFLQQKQVSPGSYVRVGDSVGTVVRTDVLRFRGTVPERYSLSLRIGQPVQLQVESIGTLLEATVTRVSPALDLLSRSLLFEAKIENPEGRFRSGLFAEARIVVDDTAQVLAIPQSSLLEFAGAEKVWTVINGEAREQQVLAGERRGDRVEILQGLRSGDQILQDVTQGMLARVIPFSREDSGIVVIDAAVTASLPAHNAGSEVVDAVATAAGPSAASQPEPQHNPLSLSSDAVSSSRPDSGISE